MRMNPPADPVAEWLARGVCSQGHALFGPADLVRRDDQRVCCGACEAEMSRERAAVWGTGQR